MLKKLFLILTLILTISLSPLSILFAQEPYPEDLFELVGMDIPDEELPEEPKPEPEPEPPYEIQ